MSFTLLNVVVSHLKLNRNFFEAHPNSLPWGDNSQSGESTSAYKSESDKQAFHKLDTVEDVALGDSDLFPGKSEEKREVCAVHHFQCIQFQLCIYCFSHVLTQTTKKH